MHRVLVEVGPFTIYTYGVMLAGSFLFGVWVCGRRAPAHGFTRDQIYDSAIPVLLSGLVGAKLAYVVTSFDEVSFHWREWLSLVRGGFVYYGGVIGGAAGAIWWAHRQRFPALAFGDLCSPGMGFSLAIGRLGCWLNGCCYGKAVGWGLKIPDLGDGIARHPVQLYEAVGALVIGLALLPIRRREPARYGATFALFLVGYSALRFGLEFLRDDPRGPALAGLSVSQALSLVALGIGVWLFRRRGAG